MDMTEFNSELFLPNWLNMIMKVILLKNMIKKCIWMLLMRFMMKLRNNILILLLLLSSLDWKYFLLNKIKIFLLKCASLIGIRLLDLILFNKKISLGLLLNMTLLLIKYLQNSLISTIKRFIMLEKPKIIELITLMWQLKQVQLELVMDSMFFREWNFYLIVEIFALRRILLVT